MYKMQLCNVYSQDVIREFIYEKVITIEKFIERFRLEIGELNYIYGESLRPYEAEYVTHNLVKEDDDVIYKIFLKVKLAENNTKMKR